MGNSIYCCSYKPTDKDSLNVGNPNDRPKKQKAVDR